MAKFVLTAEIVLQAPKNVNQVVNNIQSQLNNIQANVNIQGASTANKQIQSLTQSTNQASSAAEKMGKSFTASVRRFSAMAIANRAVSLFTSTLSGAIKESISFERELVKISQVTGKSINQLSGLTSAISDLSTSLGVSSQNLLSVSRILAQTGLSAKDTEVALGTLARTELAPTFDNITQTAEGAVAILNQFGQGAGALESQLGSLNAVAGQFAVEAGDLVAAIRRTGGVFKSAGGDLNELIALFTSVRATTRESAESIATGLRTIFTRIQRPETIDYLRQFGVELTDIEGKFVGPYEATRRLSQALAGLGERDLTFVQIAEQLGGFRQIGKVLPLLQQFTVAQNALKAAQEGQSSLASDAATAQAALAIQITKVKEEFSELVRNFTSSTSFQLMADTVLNLASALIKLADSLAPILPLLTAFAGIKLVGGLASGLGGVAKGLGFNQGGKVEYLARGGIVPGTGNGDTVPAMLTPGEFVIKKSSVQKLGAENLSRMNSGGTVQKYADGGQVNVKVKDGAVGGFFLNPEKGSDRDFPINVRSPGKITNPNIISKFKTGTVASVDEQLKSLVPAARARVFGGVSKTGKEMVKGSGFDSNTKVKQSEAQGNKEVTFKDLGSVGEQRLEQEVNIASSTKGSGAGLSVGSITGIGKGYLPGTDMKQNASVSSAVSLAAQKILTQGVEQASQQIASLANFGGAITPNKDLESGGNRLANDPNAKASVEGFLYEGVIDSLTGAKLAGGQSSFDFPYSSIKSHTDALQKFFAPTASLDSLVNADAKRSVALAPSIGPKVLGDINAGNMKGYDVLPAKFAAGGAARGSDTVPAMLTPGEFVVNKSSASSIGYGNLHRMNKVGKYAKGGVVHKFGSGTGSGGVPSGGGAGIDVTGLQNALGSLASSLTEVMAELQAFSAGVNNSVSNTSSLNKSTKDLNDQNDTQIKTNNDLEKSSMSFYMGLTFAATAMQMLTPVIDETSGYFDYLANSVSAAIMQMLAVAGIMQQFAIVDKLTKGIDGLTKITKDFRGSLSAAGTSIMSMGKSVYLYIASMFTSTSANAANTASSVTNTVATGINTAAKNTNSSATLFAAMSALFLGSTLGMVVAVFLGIVVVAVAIAAALGLAAGAAEDYAKAQKESAIEDGDVERAGSFADDEAGWKQFQDLVWATALPMFNLGTIADALSGGLEKQRKAAITKARADASLVKSSEAVEKAQTDGAEAFKQFENGFISAGEALAKTAESGKAVVESQREVAAANIAAQAAVVTWSSTFGQFLKNLTGFSFGFSTIDDNQLKADKEIKERNTKQEENEASYIAANQKSMNALMKQTLAAGGSLQDFYNILASQNPSLHKLVAGTEATETAFDNMRKEVERTRKAFNAMNLHFQSINGNAAALSVEVENLMRGMDSGAGQLESALATIEVGLTNAAQGLSDQSFSNAMDVAVNTLKSLGGSDAEIKKFEGNIRAINEAQKFYVNATHEAKAAMLKDFQSGRGGEGTAPQRQKALAKAITNNIPDNLGPEVKERIEDAIAGMELEPGDLDQLMAGNFSVLDKVLKDLGDNTLEQVKKAFEDMIKVEQQRLALVQQLVALEQKLLDAKKGTADVEIEARELEEKFGGRKFSQEERRGMLLDKGNVGNKQTGLPDLKTGSGQEFRERNEAAKKAADEVGAVNKAAATSPTAKEGTPEFQKQKQRQLDAQRTKNTEDFQNKEAGVDSFAKDELKLKRDLLKSIEKEIKAIEAKEKAEKKAADALLGGSYEDFVNELAAQGAVAAAATGDATLMSGYSRTDFGRGSKNLDEMEKAGVDDLYGMDISDLNVKTREAGLRAGGIYGRQNQELAAAGMGKSDEVKALNAQANEIISTMPDTARIEETLLENQIAVTQRLIESIKALHKAVVANTNSRKNNAKADEEKAKDSEKGTGEGTGTGTGGGAGTGTGGASAKDSSATSMVSSDGCCDGVSDVRVVNTGDFDTESQKGDLNSKSLAGILANNPVMISVAKRAIDSKPLVKAVKNALVPVGKVVKNVAKSTFQAAKKVMPKGRPKPVSSLDPDFIVPKPADAADAAKAAAQEQSTASKVLDSVTEAVKSKIDSGLDAAKGVPEVAKAVKESLKSMISNVSMPEFKMPDLGISDFGSGLRAKDGIVNPTNPASKAAMDALPEAVEASKAAKAGASLSKGLKTAMNVLGPVADVADVIVGGVTGATRTEETRGNLSIDKGLDNQNTAYKTLIGVLTGTPTMGGSVTSSLSGLVGGPQAEVGSTTDLALSSGEAVARGASIGATAGIPFGPAGIAVGAAGGAVIGGGAELVKAIGFLQQAVEESTKSAEKAEGLRNASKDETGLDVVVRNLVGANANAKLDLEEAKASGDKDKIASAESNLKNTQQALDNNIQQRREKGGDLRGTVFTSGRPKVDAELKKQQAFSDKVVAANRQARADEAKAAEARAAVIKENKKSASQESTGQFDYRTGLPTQTMFDIPQQEKDPYKAAEDAIAESQKFIDSLPDPKTMVAQMTADRESAEAEKEAQAKEANISTPTVKVEAKNMEDDSDRNRRDYNLNATPEQLEERGIKSIYTYDDNLAMNDTFQPGDVKERTPEYNVESNRMARESEDRSLGGNQDYAVDNDRITPSEGFSFSENLNSRFGVSGKAPIADKVVQPQATATDSVPTTMIEAPLAPGEQASKTPTPESTGGGTSSGGIASAFNAPVNPEREAAKQQMEEKYMQEGEAGEEAEGDKGEKPPKKEQEAIAEALSSKEQPTNTGDCCSQTLEILKQILEAIKNIGQYDPSELGSMTVANPEAIAKPIEEAVGEESANDAAKVESELDKSTRKTLETKELQEAKKEEQEEYKEPRNKLGLTASQNSQLERTARSESAQSRLGRLSGASKAGSKFNQGRQDKEQRIIDQEQYKSAQDFTAGLNEEEKKEVALGFDTQQKNPFLAKGDYDNEKSNNFAQMQQQKRIAYAQRTGGRLKSEDENYLKFEADRKIAASTQANEKNKLPEEKMDTAYASQTEQAMEAGTGKFDVNTQKEITNPFLPLIDSIDKELKIAKETGDSKSEDRLVDQKELAEEASSIFSQVNPERKASDDIALSGNFYKDAIVILKAILDAISSCCGGGGVGMSDSAASGDLFNFTKTFDETDGKGIPQGVPVDSVRAGAKSISKEVISNDNMAPIQAPLAPGDRAGDRTAQAEDKKSHLLPESLGGDNGVASQFGVDKLPGSTNKAPPGTTEEAPLGAIKTPLGTREEEAPLGTIPGAELAPKKDKAGNFYLPQKKESSLAITSEKYEDKSEASAKQAAASEAKSRSVAHEEKLSEERASRTHLLPQSLGGDNGVSTQFGPSSPKPSGSTNKSAPGTTEPVLGPKTAMQAEHDNYFQEPTEMQGRLAENIKKTESQLEKDPNDHLLKRKLERQKANHAKMETRMQARKRNVTARDEAKQAKVAPRKNSLIGQLDSTPSSLGGGERSQEISRQIAASKSQARAVSEEEKVSDDQARTANLLPQTLGGANGVASQFGPTSPQPPGTTNKIAGIVDAQTDRDAAYRPENELAYTGSGDLSTPLASKGELTSGGSFDNGQFSAGSPFQGDSGGSDVGMKSSISRLSAMTERSTPDSMNQMFASNMEGSVGGLNFTETNSILGAIHQTLMNIEVNTSKTSPMNGPQAQQANENGNLGNVTDAFQNIFSTFNSDFQNAISRLENVNIEIKISPINVTVDLNGGAVLSSLKRYVSEELMNEVQKQIAQYQIGNNGKLSKSSSTLPSGGGS